MNKNVIATAAVSAVLVAVVAGIYVNKKAEDKIRFKMDEMSSELVKYTTAEIGTPVSLSYDDVSANVFTSNYSVRDIKLSAPDFGQFLTIGQMVSTSADPKNFDNYSLNDITIIVPEEGAIATIKKVSSVGFDAEKLADKASMSIEGIKAMPPLVDKMAEEQQLNAKQATFFKDLELGLNFDYAYDGKGGLQYNQAANINNKLAISQNVTLANMETFWQLMQDMTGLTIEEKLALNESTEYQEQVMLALSNAAIKKGSVELTNDKLLEQAVQIFGEAQGADFEMMQGMALMTVSADEELPTVIKDNLVKFIKDPKRLAASVKFDKPLVFTELENHALENQHFTTEQWIDFANFTISAN